MVTPVQASSSCSAVNSGAFNLTNTSLGASSSSILFAWAVGDQITLTLSSSDGISRIDGFYHGSTFAAGTFGALSTTTVPATGSVQIAYTVVSTDLTNGIAVDPENNDSVTATCTPGQVPTVTSISPTAGPDGGGTTVTITGTGFINVVGVSFGPTAAANTVNSTTQITATAPAGSGTVDVTVSTGAGTSATSSADQYTYIPVPTVTSVSPANGRTAGGTTVTIGGTNLNGATTVSFGGVSAAIISDTATSITATTPAHASGTVDVTVTTPAGGTSATSAADQFTYFAPPTVVSISPNAGQTAGGVTVTIIGTNFTGATGVNFGSNPATFTVNSTSQITATSPAASAGVVDVTVMTPGGRSATSASDQFTYGGYRTWVSAVSGDDLNPCTTTSPCLTFAGALANTIAGGEINVLSPGDYGPTTITKAISIYNNDVGEGGVLAAGTNGIVVQAGATDTVILKGLDIEGLGTGQDGIKILTGLQVYVINCRVHDFSGNGINMTSSTSGARLLVKDSQILQNGTSNSNPLTGGININGTANAGIISDTHIDKNLNFAVQASGASNAVAVTRTELLGSPNGINLVSGGTSVCVGTSNHIAGGFTCTTSQAFQ